ncbi:MAG: deoxyribodipyrimidine photo-lyase, partial [Planctomycetota bacterium]
MPELSQLINSLPVELGERAEVWSDGACDGPFVMYWMRTAVRADENPALEAAIALANELDLPIFVYHALSETYPYASDRHHTFILQGARDVQSQLAHRKIGYAFHLEREGHRGHHLKTLTDQAALVVTEDMPVQPLVHWMDRLRDATATPIVMIDTACILPMRQVGQSYTRAFKFRDATRRARAQRLASRLEPIQPKHDRYVPKLPFEPVNLAESDLEALVAECQIDHSIAAVPHTVGGSSAGYARWDSFKENGLKRYAKTRNNALIDGVSRMSAYLHFGMVSPQRIAREAHERGGEGAEKYLDELLIWRELAYAFFNYQPDHEELTAVPDWAIESLKAHESDPRETIPSWETLARGRTGDQLWDAAQRSLLIHGELHNNVRMTWGKAFLSWTKNASDALRLMIDLNHRYALDGRDPASYGGLLWCLGQFDRPFEPHQPILGAVRPRPTREHAKRLDPQKYFRRCTRPLANPMPRIAIVGAGLSGVTCGRILSDHGFAVTIFEKSRGAGGR